MHKPVHFVVFLTASFVELHAKLFSSTYKFLNVNITAEKKKNTEQYSESPKIFGTC